MVTSYRNLAIMPIVINWVKKVKIKNMSLILATKSIIYEQNYYFLALSAVSRDVLSNHTIDPNMSRLIFMALT